MKPLVVDISSVPNRLEKITSILKNGEVKGFKIEKKIIFLSVFISLDLGLNELEL